MMDDTKTRKFVISATTRTAREAEEAGLEPLVVVGLVLTTSEMQVDVKIRDDLEDQRVGEDMARSVLDVVAAHVRRLPGVVLIKHDAPPAGGRPQ